MAASRDVTCEKVNRCGLVTLNRPYALNALTGDMIAQMERYYRVWAEDLDVYGIVLQAAGGRAFCAGGDVRAFYEWHQADELGKVLAVYALEYQHNWTLDRFIKPHVALMDGVCMGGGLGISIHGTHRVGTRNLRLAMPEVGIGFFPDVGATYFLPRLRGETGLYLALTGRAIGLADAYRLGFLTHCVPPEKFDALRAAMMEAEPVDAMLDSLHQDPGAAEIDRLQPAIDRLFAASSAEEVLDWLDAEQGEWAEWARSVASDIRAKSPTALKVAFRQMRQGAGLTLDQALKLEYRLAVRFVAGSDFFEGIRASLIDKDRAPRWTPASLAEVSTETVEAFFAPLDAGELELVNPFARMDPPSL